MRRLLPALLLLGAAPAGIRLDGAPTQGGPDGQGQALGVIGTTGHSTGPHLHRGVVWRGVRAGPRPLAGPMRADR